MAKHESSPGISPAKKNKYGIEAGQILMQNIQERLTGLWAGAKVVICFMHVDEILKC